MPFFSIIIPTYNYGNFIVNTLNSVLSQDFDDYEVLVINDGSKDNTDELIAKNFGENKKLRYFRIENSERGAARNYGFKKSEGKYIVFFDSDDIMKPDHLKVLQNEIIKYPTVNYFATKYELLRNGKIFPSSVSKISEGFYEIDLVLKGNPFACHFCIKKNNQSLNLFPKDRKYAIMEDWMFLVQNLINDKIYIINRTTILVSDHPARSMRSDNQLIIQKRLLAADWIIENLPLVPKQISTLKGYSFYFCAIHSYLDNNLKNGLKFWWKAVNEIGLRKELLMLLPKILIEKKLIKILNVNKILYI